MPQTSIPPITILVIDDTPEILAGTARLLISVGYTVLTTATGANGLRLAQEERPDLILLDVVLPDGDGRDLCRLMKEDPRLQQSFIILTSNVKTASADQSEGLELGADGYIVRPIANRELLARVAAFVRIKRTEDALRTALYEVHTLRGILPICMHCKKIRDDQGYWSQVEVYIRDHTNAEFSHGICPECEEKYYPEFESDDGQMTSNPTTELLPSLPPSAKKRLT
ncbi:MAG: response regulator transcription factor [bacterium]